MKHMILAFAGLVCAWSICGGSNAQPKAATPDARVPRQVTGHGETVETAKKDAVKKAIDEITSALKVQSFVVTEEYIRENVLLDVGQPGADVKVDGIADPFKAWKLTFRTDNEWWSDIERRDREAERKLRATDRETQAFRGVLGLSILLLAGFGYLRLDDYTQRRYTTWLRVAGAGVLATVIAGWWIWFQAPG